MLQGGDKNLFSGGLLGQIVATFAAFSEDKKLEIRNELQDLLFTYWAECSFAVRERW